MVTRVFEGRSLRIELHHLLNPWRSLQEGKWRVPDVPQHSLLFYADPRLSKPNAIDSLQTAFALYDLIEQAEANGEKVNNYALAKQVGIELEQRNSEEEWDVAYKRRVVSVAVSRKKKEAVDAINSVVNGVFPS